LIFFLEQLSTLLEPFECRLGYGLSRGGFAIGAFSNLLIPESVMGNRFTIKAYSFSGKRWF